VAAPPPVIGLSTSVHRGETIDIPLRIYGTRSQTLDFRIRSQPQTGTLSAVTRTGQESASVRYTPTANIAVKRDRFSYAVSSREGVSAAADLWINIIDLSSLIHRCRSIFLGRCRWKSIRNLKSPIVAEELPKAISGD
jgi:hypothetical protein